MRPDTSINVSCPTCGEPLHPEDVNVSRDLALCLACGEIGSFADALEASGPTPVQPVAPPGVWFNETADGFEVGASTFTPWALFAVPFAFVWVALTAASLFVAISHAQVLHVLQLVPFAVIGALFSSLAFMTLFGRVVVKVSGDEGSVFTGIAGLGSSRKFAWSTVRDVIETVDVATMGSGVSRVIRLTGETPITFGRMMSEPRRSFVQSTLRHELKSPRKRKSLEWCEEV